MPGEIWLETTASGEVRLTRAIVSKSGFTEYAMTSYIPHDQRARVAETLLGMLGSEERRAIAKRIVKEEKKQRRARRQQQRDAILFLFNKLRNEGHDVTMVEMERV